MQVDETSEFTAITGLFPGRKIFRTSSAAGMRVFQFVPDSIREGIDQRVLYLHLQCPWRIEDSTSVICGSEDFYYRDDDATALDESWDPNFGGSKLDSVLRRIFSYNSESGLIENTTNDFVCTRVALFLHGIIEFSFNNNTRLIVFPAKSSGEGWRVFFQDSEEHIVYPEEL